ncbi:MAG: hypothetical protein H6715_00790 [Myxococcales bacterium]|nr:hypothetical protein [Myxococcales bacterium]MCB9708032.1 hypothetical protein [Myxococcales bacterium]
MPSGLAGLNLLIPRNMLRAKGFWLPLALGAIIASAPLKIQAQAQSSDVVRLNREAMVYYTQLELKKAKAKLAQAIKVAKKKGIAGAALARTHANLGVVYVGGEADNAKGLDAFVEALKLDPKIALDPLTSTPEVKTVFALAQAKAGIKGRGSPSSRPSPPVAAAPGGSGISLPHQSIPEQLRKTPVPVYLELPGGLRAGQVHLFFKGGTMNTFAQLEMTRLGSGWGMLIPCYHVTVPSVQYYIVAFGEDGAPLGFAGTASAPFSVPVVEERTMPPPALPGAVPPETCASDSVCPPGVAGCDAMGAPSADAGAGYDEECSETEECQQGLVCRDDRCVFQQDGDDEDAEASSDAPRFFGHLGMTLGLGWVDGGMRADRSAPAPSDYPESWGGALIGWVPEGEGKCSDNDNGNGDDCVEVNTPGVVPTVALRATVGYYIWTRFALAASFRFQLERGSGQMSGMQIGIRGQYLFTTPRETGLNVAGLLGFTYGQISPKPPQQSEEPKKGWPFVLAGLNGANVGAVVGYRFTRNFGVHVTPEFHILFPNVLLNLDLTAGVEVGF